MRSCAVCGFPHHPLPVIQTWINVFGVNVRKDHTDTLRAQQTERWHKIIENHAGNGRVWGPRQVFHPKGAEKYGQRGASPKNTRRSRRFTGKGGDGVAQG